VSAIEKVLIPFEKSLPSTEVKKFLMTPEVVENPEIQLQCLLKAPEDPKMLERFERAKEKEFENIKGHISRSADDFSKRTGLAINERRMSLIAALYLGNVSDINTAFDDFKEMVDQIRLEEASLVEKLDVNISFDESAIDEIINQAIKTGQEAGPLAFQLAKRLEYGLNLVKDRSGIDSFIITDEAVTDMEKFINDFIKEFYRREYPTEST
jgi:ATP-dependent Clp protease ATP-binding subunit ClpX